MLFVSVFVGSCSPWGPEEAVCCKGHFCFSVSLDDSASVGLYGAALYDPNMAQDDSLSRNPNGNRSFKRLVSRVFGLDFDAPHGHPVRVLLSEALLNTDYRNVTAMVTNPCNNPPRTLHAFTTKDAWAFSHAPCKTSSGSNVTVPCRGIWVGDWGIW